MNKELVRERKQEMKLGWDRILEVGDIRSTFDQLQDNDPLVVAKYAGLKTCGYPYSRYYADREGRIFGPSGRQLIPYLNNSGYSILNMLDDTCHKTTKSVNRLVALAWLPNPHGLSDTDHIDRDKANNKVENLQWLSHTENLYRRKTKSCKRAVNAVKVSTGEATAYPSISAAARSLGISYSTIRGIAENTYTLPDAGGYSFIFVSGK